MKNLISSLLIIGLIGISSCSKQATCPNGYTGSDCTTQKTPTQILVTKVTVTNFPATNNGTDWNITEATGYADIYPVITDASGSTVYSFSSAYQQDVNYQNSTSFTPSSPISVSSAQNLYTITLYNHNNVTADDDMGSAYKILYNPYGGFPSTVTVSSSSVTFVLNLQYSF
jgi:hypothetical protein